jgi:hypothetical protein
MGVYSKRKREMQADAFARMSLSDSGWRQRVGEGDDRLWWLFVKGDFAWQIEQLCVGGSEGERRDICAGRSRIGCCE